MDLRKDSVPSLVLRFIFPTTISLIVISLYTIVDGIFISRGVGSEGIAAVNIGYPIINFTVAISLMFGIGGSTLIALSKGDIDFQNKCFSHIIFLNLVSYVVIASITMIFLDPIMIAFGSNKELIPMVRSYMFPCIVAVFFLMLACSLNVVVRNDNAPNRVMISTIIGAGLNIILDYIFIFKFNFGISGGAYATAISQVIGASYLCFHFVNSSFKLDLSFKSIDFKLIRNILSIGFPSFILEFAMAVLTIVLNIAFMSKLGVFGVSAYSIVSYSFMIIRMLFVGIAQGIQPLVSYSYGRKDFERAMNILKFAHRVSFVVAILASIFVFSFSSKIIKLFTLDEVLLLEGSKGLILYSSALIFLGFNLLNVSFLQSVKNIKISNLISFSRSLIFVIINVVVLGSIFGVNGVWLALPVADLTTALLTFPFIKGFTVNYMRWSAHKFDSLHID